MGMVFASRRTQVDIEFLELIEDGDGLRELGGLRDVEKGDIVVYGKKQSGEVTHVGIIIDLIPNISEGRLEASVMSKWGNDGEYLHALDHVPFAYGEPIKFLTDRRAQL